MPSRIRRTHTVPFVPFVHLFPIAVIFKTRCLGLDVKRNLERSTGCRSGGYSRSRCSNRRHDNGTCLQAATTTSTTCTTSTTSNRHLHWFLVPI